MDARATAVWNSRDSTAVLSTARRLVCPTRWVYGGLVFFFPFPAYCWCCCVSAAILLAALSAPG